MVNLYADLVLLGVRALEPNEDNIPLVPLVYREKVRVEVERRLAAGEFKL